MLFGNLSGAFGADRGGVERRDTSKSKELISKGLIEEFINCKTVFEDEKRAEYEFYVSQRGEVAEFMDAV